MLLLGIWEGQETLPKALRTSGERFGLALRAEGNGVWT